MDIHMMPLLMIDKIDDDRIKFGFMHRVPNHFWFFFGWMRSKNEHLEKLKGIFDELAWNVFSLEVYQIYRRLFIWFPEWFQMFVCIHYNQRIDNRNN